jgi:His-Xaa-Ser system protein HxsD
VTGTQPVEGERLSTDRIATVAFATSVHSLDAVKRAAYAFMARATISIEPSESELRCTLDPESGEDIERLVRDFRREVLDQDLRIEIEAKTEPLRNMILGLAFSRIAPDD